MPCTPESGALQPSRQPTEVWQPQRLIAGIEDAGESEAADSPVRHIPDPTEYDRPPSLEVLPTTDPSPGVVEADTGAHADDVGDGLDLANGEDADTGSAVSEGFPTYPGDDTAMPSPPLQPREGSASPGAGIASTAVTSILALLRKDGSPKASSATAPSRRTTTTSGMI
eukprot:TRINITY_DN66513_c0_g1_i1.p1 TRINITY_DN66513_c0_g1~~TRINITY_DN66513_c0_g1_i1.p1  ORF type:complete len:169 (+),score=8.16 TRINITY_DN66513_c0_g1_i1:1-507(+)